MPRGGKRPGAGAPKGNRNAVGAGAPKGNRNAVGAGAPEGNLNALKHGKRSRNWRELSRQNQKHPGRGHHHAPRPGLRGRNLNALKNGRHSKTIDRFIEEHPEKLPGRLSREKNIEYLVSQLKHCRDGI